MKLDCEVIRDLLPLYAEKMVSEKSRALTEEHLAECEPCRQYLQALTAPEPDVQFRVDSAQQFVKYEKKQKRKAGAKAGIVAGVLGICIAWTVFRIVVGAGAVGLMLLGSATAKVQVDTDPSHYAQYIGENADNEHLYKHSSEIDERIFPAALTDQMEVCEYKNVYYNPWDPQYLSYLTVKYSPEDYAAEVQRLEACGISDYEGYYSVTGFPSETLAVWADDYSGFVYAFHMPEKENTITYCEIIFCNYIMDLKYEEYMPAEYFPLGFNAHDGNPYRKKMMGEN